MGDSTPQPDFEDGLKSHRVTGLEEELTPVGSVRGSQSSLSALGERPSGESAEASQMASSPEPPARTQTGGGVTGFLSSLLGGGQKGPNPDHPHTTPAGEQKVTHEGNLQGSTATVATAPETTAVPASLDEASPQPVGVARTEIKEPVSEYATALESIAGPAEAADPSKKYGASLEPLTGDTAPTAGIAATAAGVVESVSAAAGSAVESLKQATGYGASGEAAQTESAPGSTGGVITPADLPKAGVVKVPEDGSSPEIVPMGGQTGTGQTATGGPAPEAAGAGQPVAYEAEPAGVAGSKTTADTANGPVEASGDGSKLNTKPPVSAFASQSNANGTAGAKTVASEPAASEIKEDATGTTAAKGSTTAEPKAAAASGKSKEEDKAKTNGCGCCVIS